ncbi:pentatricopeptide repeat-containing protein At3g53700, chloroplastic-like [Macadamia integrifolia]|uniref:pentatricopeptide repeat-containing protein At3g53700, chloroplastic-like n=1 Tax=Macadamia integrifolia TaxID=60698 RepID=UPI001C52E47B|nr:pentatricopeptide repeat-containing protein At3g53700, chloroplastic-like [Macadamia integrifolia]XP_042481330.1 pentatricopeptide repeat-containing protein At3g53700, chloroplastic-like [Macadamia integrifolia]XP_042481331.1 pentatricopeptide repeat-containing protein At3g53700, chloroplastic-like [Macadamia integrifolia]
MLSRIKHGAYFFANLLRHPFLLFRTFSSYSKSEIRKPNALYRNPKIRERRCVESRVHRQFPLATRELRYDSDDPSRKISLVSDNLSPDVVGICSLLSQYSGPTRNLDNLLKEFKLKLNSDLVLGILMNYRKLGRTNTLGFFSWAGFQMGFSFDDSVIEYMADFLGRRKLFDDLKCLLMTVSATKGRVSSRAVSICIRFLGRQGRIKEALCLFEEMETELKCKPDNLVFNNILYVLCKKENSEDLIDIALAVFRRIESPDSYSYSNILVGLCKFGRLESALEVFYEMGRVNLVPTRTAANVLIGELCKSSTNEDCINKVKVTNSGRPFTILVPNVGSNSGGILFATQVFWAIHDLGLLPSAFIINQLISVLCQFKRIEEAVEILKVVEERKLSCVDESYTILIRGLCDARRVNEACQLFGRMISQGLKPKLVIYNSLICLLCKLGTVEEAERLFEIMNKKRCVPDNVTYTALIHAHAVARNWEAAYGLLIEMLGLGWCPHFHTYNYVDSLLKEHGRVDLSLKLEGKLQTQVLYKHCKAGRLELAYEKLSSMVEKGFYPPIYVRDAFLHAFQKSGKGKMAHELLDRMDRISWK